MSSSSIVDTKIPFPADAAERAAALNPEQSFLVEAPAGSGKTGLLVQRFLKLLCCVQRPEAVLALTFTKKATAEMRERVLKALDLTARDPLTLSDFDRTTHELATRLLKHDRQHGWNLRTNSYRLNIRTIDSLCGEITRSLPLLSNAVGQMTPVENAMPLYRRAARAVTLRLGGDNVALNDALRTVLLRRDADLLNCETLLANMLATREQWGRLIPLTPEALTDDFLDREVKPRLDRTLETIVCLTLTRLQQNFPEPELHELTTLAVQLAAADGYENAPNPIARCADLSRTPGTAAADAEHWALLARILLNASSPYQWRRSMNINHLGFVTTAAEKKRLKALIETLATNDALHEQLCGLRNLPPAAIPGEDWRMTKALFHLLHFALLELQAIFRKSNVCDFTEHSLTARAVLEQQTISSTTAFELLHLLVDEMQDTSTAQYNLLEALTRAWDGTTRTVFLVGDPKQSIYLFRQARVENFLISLASRSLGSIPLKVLRLSTNFRSTAPLVHEFNRLFSPIFAAASSGGISYTPAVAAASGSEGTLACHIDTLSSEHGQPSRVQVRREQAEHIVHTIHALRSESADGRTPNIAVLVRAREHALPIIRLLTQAGIPFRGVELERLNERTEVLDTLALTRALLHPADRVAWLAVLRAPWCGATLADLHHLAQAEDVGTYARAPRLLFRERSATLDADAQSRIQRTLDILNAAVDNFGRIPLSELVERTSQALGADLFRNETERNNVRRFLELLETMEAEFLSIEAEYLQTRLATLYAEASAVPDAVEVMTIHKAKGLEWDVVFVPEVQRTTRSNAQRLLDWLELPATESGEAGVLLAPIPPRGRKTAELGCYVQTARRRQEDAEVARLLYVVVTRARKAVHLYAAPALKKDSSEVIHVAGTLLHAAWPALGEFIQQEVVRRQANVATILLSLHAEAEEGSSDTFRDLSMRSRVAEGFDPRALRPPITLPWLHAAAAAAPGSEFETVHRPEGTLHARALGNVVHALFDLLAQQIAAKPASASPPEDLQAEVHGWMPRIRALLRDAGTGGPALERDARIVLDLLLNTVNSPEGRWLLQPHAAASTEQALIGSIEEGARTVLRLDRSFLAGPIPGTSGTDTLWIVDYKTTSPGRIPLPEFLAEERERYAPQLRNYAKLRAATLGTPPNVMLALFYPAIPMLDAWPWQSSANQPFNTADAEDTSSAGAVSVDA